MKEAQISVSAADWARGEQQLTRYANGDGRGLLADHYLAYLVLAVRLERMINVVAWYERLRNGEIEAIPTTGLDEWIPPKVNSPEGLIMAERAQRWFVPHNGLGDAYLAVRHVLRNTLTTSRLIVPGRPLSGTNAEQLGIVWPVAFVVVGLAAVGAAYYYGKDRNEKEAEIAGMSLAANVDKYLKNMDARLLAGQSIPAPPATIQAMANQERQFPYWAIGAGIVLGGAAVMGLRAAFTRPAIRVNPRRSVTPRRRRLPARRANPTKRTRAKTKPAKRSKRSNPLKTGYSRETISANISRLRAEGKPPSVAVAASLRSARAAYRKRHPSAKFPAYLQAPKPKRKTSGTKAKPKRKTTARRTTSRRANPKRTTKKKADPKKKANPKRARMTKSCFIAKQKKKGRSPKQAAADWKARQRLAKARKGKGRRRR